MSNHEIRCKAWRLYREHMVTLVILTLGYTTLQNILKFVWGQIFGWNELLFVLVAWLLLSPLSLGAVLCLAHLWRTESKPNYMDLTTFYRSVKGWGGAIVLYLIQGGAVLLPILLPIVLINTSLIILGVLIGIAVAFWLLLRIYMSEVLFVSEEDLSAWDAIRDSFSRMSGQVADLLCMLIVVGILPNIIGLVIMITQPVGLGVQIAVLVFEVFYTPFSAASGLGWVVERLNDEEQPEEASGPPKNPLLRDIANDLSKGGHQPGMQDKS